jgi:hypothetical protein
MSTGFPANFSNYPPGVTHEPNDGYDSLCADIEAAITYAIRRAVMGSGVKLAGQIVQVERVETVPFCDRKEIMVRPCFVLTRDGGDLDEIVAHVGCALAEVFSRVQ